MPHTIDKPAISGKTAQPKNSAKLLEELIPGPVTKEQFDDPFQDFKKALIERARNRIRKRNQPAMSVPVYMLASEMPSTPSQSAAIDSPAL